MRDLKIPCERIINELDSMLARNDYTAAKSHLKFWLGEAKLVRDEKAALMISNELMGLSRKLGEEENAFRFVSDALKLIEELQIPRNVGAATTYINCATVYKAFGRADEAMPLFEQAKEIYEAELEKGDDRLGGLYNNMALALVDLKDFDRAEECYNQALTVMEGIEGKEPEQAITYLNMASAAEAQFGLTEGAEKISKCAKAAQALLDKGKNRTDGNYAFVCEKCAPVFGYYGYFFYENELHARAGRIYEGN